MNPVRKFRNDDRNEEGIFRKYANPVRNEGIFTIHANPVRNEEGKFRNPVTNEEEMFRIVMEIQLEKNEKGNSQMQSEIKTDMDIIKRRQDQAFQKQDIIHSTLAGEIPQEHHSSESGFHSFLSPSETSFRSFRFPSEPDGFHPFSSPNATPSVTSLVAWAPPFPHQPKVMSSLPQTGLLSSSIHSP